MKRSLILSDTLREFIRHLPPNLKRKIKNGLREIAGNPSAGKTLRDELAGLRSYRIGNCRIVYQVNERAITLITVGPRKTVYQKAALELKHLAGYWVRERFGVSRRRGSGGGRRRVPAPSPPRATGGLNE